MFKKKYSDPSLPQKINELIFKIIDCDNSYTTKEKINKQIESQVESKIDDMGRGVSIKASKSEKKNEQQRHIYKQELITWIASFSHHYQDFFDKLDKIERLLGYKKGILLNVVLPYCKQQPKREVKKEDEKKEVKKEEEKNKKEEVKKEIEIVDDTWY